MFDLFGSLSRKTILAVVFVVLANVLVVNIFAQNELSQKHVRIEDKLINLNTMLNTIHSQTGIKFCFVDDSVSNISILFSKKVNRIRVDSLLEMFCPVAKIEYSYKHGQIVLRKKHPKAQVKIAKPLIESLPKRIEYSIKSKSEVAKSDEKVIDPTKNKEVIIKYDTIVKTIIDTVYITLHDTVRIIIRDTIFQKINVTRIINQKANNLDVSLGLYFSPEYINYQKITSTDGNTLPSDSMRRNNQLKLSYSVGIDLRLAKNRWFASVGLSYSQLNSQLQYFKQKTNIQSSNQWQSFYKEGKVYSVIEEYIEQPSGKVVQIWDSVPANIKDSTLVTLYDTTYSSSHFSQKNQYQYFSIPIIFGYTFLKTEHVSAYGMIGCSAGLLFGVKGKHITSTGSVGETDLTHLSTFRIRGLGGLGINYSVTKSISVWSEFSLVYTWLSMYSNKENYLDKQFWSAAKFGLRYNL